MRSHYNMIANRKKLILLLEKYFKTLKEMIIGTESFMIFKVSKIIVSNYGYLMSTQGHFQIKLTMIWFCRWSSSSVRCSICKITFLGTGNLHMITNKFWCEYLYVAYVMFLDPVLYIVLETEAYNLRIWLHEKKTSLLAGTGLVCQKITFVIHNRFWLLSKILLTLPLALNRQYQAGWRYKFFYFLFYISFCISRYHFFITF